MAATTNATTPLDMCSMKKISGKISSSTLELHIQIVLTDKTILIYSNLINLTIKRSYKPSAGIAVDISGKSPFNCNRKTIKDKNKDIPNEILSPASLGTTYVTRIRMACMLVGTMYRTPKYSDFRCRQYSTPHLPGVELLNLMNIRSQLGLVLALSKIDKTFVSMNTSEVVYISDPT